MDWDQRWNEGDTPWDHGEPAPPLAAFLRSNDIPSGTALVPGCGSGHEVRALAKAGFEATGLDLSPRAIEVAQEKVTPGAQFVVGDWFDLPEDFHQQFDWVFEHTCFCAIHPDRRDDYLKSLMQALKPGGHYMAIFYLNPQADEGPPFKVSPEELDQRFSNFRLLRAWEPGVGFESRMGREQCRLYEFSQL
ncbi:MAG: methyltransferase domain-containing protein [Verrucomicrobiota bacterium]